MKNTPLNRRDFLRTSATAAFGFYILPATARGANSRIQVACIGVAGKGRSDTLATAAAIVALCDVANPRQPGLSRRAQAKMAEVKKGKGGETKKEKARAAETIL